MSNDQFASGMPYRQAIVTPQNKSARSKLRIAHMLRKYDPREWGGTETAVRELILGLRACDADSVVFAPQNDVYVENARDPFRCENISMRNFRAFLPIFNIDDEARKRLVALGGNVMSLDAPIRLYSEPDIDVIHTHALNRLGGIARLVARRRRIPFVVTIHGGYLDLPQSAADKLAAPMRGGIDYGKCFGWALKSRHVVEDADAVITINPREAQLLRERYPSLRVELIPHGIPIARYTRDHRDAAESFLPALRGRTILLFVGRIDAIKNQAFLVNAMPEIKRRFPNAALVLVGPVTDVEHERYVRTRITELRLEESVFLPGALAPDDPRLIGLYQFAHLFVLPSLTEPFGLVMLEAWAAGCPVLASATSGPKLLVRDGINGFLFQTNDTTSFLAALNQVFENDEHRIAMGEAGRRMVRDEFDTLVTAQKVRNLYADLSSRPRHDG